MLLETRGIRIGDIRFGGRTLGIFANVVLKLIIFVVNFKTYKMNQRIVISAQDKRATQFLAKVQAKKEEMKQSLAKFISLPKPPSRSK